MKRNKSNAPTKKRKILKNGKVEVFKRPSLINEEDVSKLGINPFLTRWDFITSPSDYQFRVHNKDDKKSYTIYNAPGHVLEQVSTGNFTPYLVEGKYLRIHLENNHDLRKLLYGLNASTHKLLFWVLLSLDYGKDYFLLNKAHLAKETGLSKSTIYKAEKELIAKGFISPTGVIHYYWINAQFFFLGNRCHYFPAQARTSKGDTIGHIRDKFWRRNEKFIKARIKKAENP